MTRDQREKRLNKVNKDYDQALNRWSSAVNPTEKQLAQNDLDDCAREINRILLLKVVD